MNNSVITLNDAKYMMMENPYAAYDLAFFEAKPYGLNKYMQSAIPALLAHKMQYPIETVKETYRVGKVFSFDVVPLKNTDPTVIYCATGALDDYYYILGKLFKDEWVVRLVHRYDNAIKEFISNSTNLSVGETVFGVLEMLKFKNEVVLR